MLTQSELEIYHKVLLYENTLLFITLESVFTISDGFSPQYYQPRISLRHILNEPVEYLVVTLLRYQKKIYTYQDKFLLNAIVSFYNNALMTLIVLKEDKDYTYWENTYQDFIDRIKNRFITEVNSQTNSCKDLSPYFLFRFPTLKQWKSFKKI